MTIRRVGIVDFARSPITRAKDGALNALSGLEVAAQVLRQLLERNPGFAPARVEHLALGCAFPEAENGLNLARALVVKSGLPETVAASTVNQFCGSSQQSTMMLADALALGKGDLAISVGLEHMKRVPMGGFNPMFDRELAAKGFYMGMGETAENLAKDGGIPRDAQDAFAIESHEKALAAWQEGAFAKEVVPIRLPDGTTCDRDDGPRPPEPDKVRALKPAFLADGTVTAASSSPVTTGAACVLLVAEDAAKELGLAVRAWIRSTAVAGVDWTRMGRGPVPASAKALARAGLAVADLDVVELNEAFAAQALYVIQEAGFPRDKVNPLGGAIALGHPLGMSGARIIGTAITGLERRGGRYALATMCVGGGQGVATVLERA